MFKERVVILTGAGGNLGHELALNLAKAGALLSLVDKEIEGLSQLTNECRDLGAKAISIQADLAREDQCQKIVDETFKQYGKIDLLINCAAFIEKEYFERLPDLKSLKTTMEVNYLGAVYCTKYALPYLKKSQGQIVTIVSILGKIATPGNTAYCGSKYALVGFFEALRLELRKDRVAITMVYPGYLAERMKGKKELKSNSIFKKMNKVRKLIKEKGGILWNLK